MTPASIIAIDGPAASGKSTLARHLAERLGYLYFDTGVMYRAVTLAALERELSLDDEEAVTRLAHAVDLDVLPTQSDHGGAAYVVMMDGVDVTGQLRSPEIDMNVSQVSAYPGVRQAMSRRQREIGLRGRVVMVGRDIGTVVLPDAQLKLYLDATVKERAHRRYEECLLRGEDADFDDVLESMIARDHYDSHRAVAPLKPAEDAEILDTTDLSIEAMVETALALAERHTREDVPG